MESITLAQIKELKESIEQSVESLDIDKKKLKLKELEVKSIEPDFWKDQNSAKSVMSQIENLRYEIESSAKLSDDINSIFELFQSSDDDGQKSLQIDIEDVQTRFKAFEILKFLSAKYDNQGAILSVHAGQGGTEANDWAQMILRMYTRYCEKANLSCEIVHMVSGSETGISTATLKIEGPYAFGKLKRESGTHRLVRVSPFNAQGLRQTSFAGVEVIPIIPEGDTEIEIRDEDIDFKAVRAGGAGGQHVNKTSSAVQIVHIPSGITVHSSEQRDQFQNRKAAMEILRAKLWQIEEGKREDEMRKIKGEHKIAGWGNQIRNYVLHPYKLVKDLRTDIQSNDPLSVLDGELDSFIDAQVRIQ